MVFRRSIIIVIIALSFAAVIPVANAAYADNDVFEVDVDCIHASYELDTYYHEAGDIVTFAISKVYDGYVLDHILVSDGDSVIPTERSNNAVTFVMPEHNVKIKVTFTDAKKKGLTTKEIIAVSVTAAVVAVAVGYFLFVKVIKKKKQK